MFIFFLLSIYLQEILSSPNFVEYTIMRLLKGPKTSNTININVDDSVMISQEEKYNEIVKFVMNLESMIFALSNEFIKMNEIYISENDILKNDLKKNKDIFKLYNDTDTKNKIKQIKNDIAILEYYKDEKTNQLKKEFLNIYTENLNNFYKIFYKNTENETYIYKTSLIEITIEILNLIKRNDKIKELLEENDKKPSEKNEIEISKMKKLLSPHDADEIMEIIKKIEYYDGMIKSLVEHHIQITKNIKITYNEGTIEYLIGYIYNEIYKTLKRRSYYEINVPLTICKNYKIVKLQKICQIYVWLSNRITIEDKRKIFNYKPLWG